MHKFLLWLLVPFVAICFLAVVGIPLMQKDAGYVLIAIGGYVIEMRFWMAVIVLLLIWLCLWVAKTLIKGTWRATIKTFNWWPAKAQALLWQRQERAMAALWEGNIQEAHRNFTRIAKTKGQNNNVLSLINAANTASDLALFGDAEHYLAQAEALEDKAHTVSLWVSRARLYQKQNKIDEALALANKALSHHKLHPGVLAMLLGLYRKQHDWLALQSLLPRFKKVQLLADDDFLALERDIYQGLLTQAENAKTLTEQWQAIPKNSKNDRQIEYCYLQQLLHLGCDDAVEPILRKMLKKHYDDELMTLFARTRTQDAGAQLQYAQRWLEHKGDSPVLLLALGRIAMRCELWGKAKDYFEQSLQLQPSPEAYAELAHLLAQLGEYQASNALFQQGLLFSANKAQPVADSLDTNKPAVSALAKTSS